jgi:site-specific DNA recombinase
MIPDATMTPSPYTGVIVHSLSRFFRDSLEFALYERKLEKAGVKLISITQQTSDDPAGEMARKVSVSLMNIKANRIQNTLLEP